jgi:hypothetical protein
MPTIFKNTIKYLRQNMLLLGGTLSDSRSLRTGASVAFLRMADD